MTSNRLASYLQNSLPDGMPYRSASELYLRLYCTVDGVPSDLAVECSRAGLAGVFSDLAQLGWVSDLPSSSAAARAHWDGLVESLLQGTLDFNVEDGDHAARLVGFDPVF